MTITLDNNADATRRDRWGRYLVVPPEGGKPKAYTRATTVAKAIEDQHSLIAWKARVAAKGLTIRSELLKMIAVTDDRQKLDDLVEQAAQAGGATERRDEGTALHAALERHFNGEPVPDLFAADVAAVQAALDRHGLTVVANMTERVCVRDTLAIAGTFDLIVTDGVTLWVADFKTGKTLEYSGLAFAIQLAIYANADALYAQGPAKDGSEDRREPMPPVARDQALILHVQPGSGVATIHAVDIAAGAQALELCISVREARSSSRRLIAPLDPPAQAGNGENGPAVVVPAATAGPTSKPTHRDNVILRLKALKEIDARWPAWVAERWPDGVPALASNAIMAPKDWAAIDALLALAERAAEAPFTPTPATDKVGWATELATTPAPEVVVGTTAIVDEGQAVDDESIDALLAKLATLDGPGKDWAISKLREAKDASVPLNLRAARTERAFNITRSLWRWADLWPDDDNLARIGLIHVLGDDRVQPGFPTGAVIGSLSNDEAIAWWKVADGLGPDGHLAYVCDGEGERLVEFPT